MTHGNSHRARRRRRTPRWRFVAATAALLIAGVAIYSGLEHRRMTIALAIPASGPANAASADAPAVMQASLPTDRRVFPYSIIAGGAFSADELQRAVAGDPVVAAHYAGFDLARTRVVRLSQPKLAHVSYRIGDNVYWTRRKLVIPAGERVLTDGTHMARTRCGNQIAETPAGPVADAGTEPSPAELDTPLTPTPAASQLASLGGPSASAPSGSLGGGSGSLALAGGGGLPGSFGGGFSGGGGGGTVGSGGIALTPPGGLRTPTSGPSNPPPGPPNGPGHPGTPNVPDPPGGPHVPPIQPPGLPPEFNPPTDFVPPTGDDPLPDPPGDDPQPPGDPNDPPQDPPQDPPKDTPQNPPTRDVPEPGSAVLVLLGAAGMVVRRFRTAAD